MGKKEEWTLKKYPKFKPDVSRVFGPKIGSAKLLHQLPPELSDM